MIMTTKLRMDLGQPGATPIIHATQTDSYCRNLEIALYHTRAPFSLPENCSVIIRFRKIDGTGGEYDTLPSGSSAWSVYRNFLTVALAPQVLTMPGTVMLSITIIVDGSQISTLPIQLQIEPVFNTKIAKSQDYFYVLASLPAPVRAEVGQQIQVAAVNKDGKVTEVIAVHTETGGCDDIDPDIVHQYIAEYLADNPPLPGEKGDKGDTGADGKDGTSCTHVWSGTTLSVTSASGTSSADLKGSKGDKGDAGPAGHAPVKGVDYWTAADQQEIENYIAAELAKRGQLAPEFVDSIDKCTDTSKMYVLPDGYIYAFQSGGTQEVFINVLKDVGYTDDRRINSSGGIVEWTSTDADTTGYIPCKTGDVIRVKNMPIPATYTSGAYWNKVAAYDANKTHLAQITLNIDYVDAAGCLLDAIAEDGYIVQFTVKEAIFGANVAYIAISAQDITDESEVYVNSTVISADEFRSTGHAFVPADYEERIVTLETEVGKLGGSAVPDYWKSELTAKADAIQQAMETAGRNKSAFLWYTDAHWQTNSRMSPTLLKYLIKNTPMNKVNFGGDIINDPASFTHENIKYAYEWRKMIAEIPNHHSVPGNHDLNHNTTDVRNMAYAFLIAPEESSDMAVGDGLYYYIDNNAEKTRYIYLDFMTSNHSEMVAQGQFIVDAISSVADGWHIVAIAHRWFQYISASAPTVGSVPNYEKEILKIFDEYNARGRHTESNHFSAQDFTSGKGKVEFCIGGHIHVDYDFTTDGGIPVIITASDTNQDRSSDETEDSGTVGTATEAAVYGIIADYTNSKIIVVGVGRGGSREISH